MSNGPDRRSVLRAGAAFGSLSLAGCLGFVDDDSGDSGDETDPDSGQPDGGNVSDSTGDDGDGNSSDGGENGTDPDWETIETWPQLQYDAHNTGYVHAEAPTDVEERWSVETDEGIDTSPVVADGTVYIRDKPGTVYAISDGTIDWTAEIGVDGSSEGTPVIHEDLLVAPIDGGLAGIERDGGSVRWEQSLSDQPRRLTLADGMVFVADWGGEMYAIEAATGEQRWSESPGSGGGFYGAPAVYEGDVLVPKAGRGRDGMPHVRALDIENGSGRPLIHPDAPINTGLAIRDDTLYFGADDGVYAVDPESGEEQLWHHEMDRIVHAMLAISPDAVYAMAKNDGATGGNIRCLDRATGEDLWTAKITPSLVSSPIVVGEQVAGEGPSGEARGWSTDDGTGAWRIPTDRGGYGKLAFTDGTYYGGSIWGTVYAWE